GNAYVQPYPQTAIDSGYSPIGSYLSSTVQDFEVQVAAQHANNTYLGMLKAPTLPSGPVVTGISPTTIGLSGGTITITVTGFTSDCVVDVGIVPVPPGSVTFGSSSSLTVTVPPGVGIAQVRVTNSLGTSPANPLAALAYGGPEPVVV